MKTGKKIEKINETERSIQLIKLKPKRTARRHDLPLS